jgi:hypothetical protein
MRTTPIRHVFGDTEKGADELEITAASPTVETPPSSNRARLYISPALARSASQNPPFLDQCHCEEEEAPSLLDDTCQLPTRNCPICPPFVRVYTGDTHIVDIPINACVFIKSLLVEVGEEHARDREGLYRAWALKWIDGEGAGIYR